MSKYLLGVDIGGTKTDFLITTTDGIFVDLHHIVTHNKVTGLNKDPVKRMEAVKKQFTEALKRSKIKNKDVESVGIGMVHLPPKNMVSNIERTMEKMPVRL